MIVAGNILGELSEKRPSLLSSGDENMLGRGRDEERQEQGSQGGEVRGKRGKNKGEVRGEERLESDGQGHGHGSDPHTRDQSEGRFTTKTFGVRLFVSDSNFTCFASVK